MATSLGGVDPDVAEAAALAHDLGHPPFGHLAEEALDELCRANGLEDGFEGNAQSFRIVTNVAIGDATNLSGEGIRGLNLTRATLNGILKYPWCHGGNPRKPKKWGAYQSEKTVFEWVRAEQPFGLHVKSPEAELMDWADDITFSVHDLIDFYCAGQIPLDRLSSEGENSEERDAFFEEVFERSEELRERRAGLEEAFRELVAFFPLNRRYVGSRGQRERLWQFSTLLISRFVDAISLAEPTPQRTACVKIRPDAVDEVRMLKELTWHYVILHNDLALDQRGQRQMISSVFEELHHAAHKSSHPHLFPPFFRSELQCAVTPLHKTRVVCDYVSSMTEREVTRIHRALTGRT